MRLAGLKVWALVLIAAASLPGFASAEDLGGTGASQSGQVPSKLDQQIDQAVKSNGATSAPDMDSRIRDLESTRTAIDQQKKPTISLGVSGWVDQQVQYNVKQ